VESSVGALWQADRDRRVWEKNSTLDHQRAIKKKKLGTGSFQYPLKLDRKMKDGKGSANRAHDEVKEK